MTENNKYKKIFLIGNGFDLEHKLKTTFLDFKKYLIDSNQIDKDIFFNNINNNKIDDPDWADFENSFFNPWFTDPKKYNNSNNVSYVNSSIYANNSSNLNSAYFFKKIKYPLKESFKYIPTTDMEKLKIIGLLSKYFSNWIKDINSYICQNNVLKNNKFINLFNNFTDKDNYFITLNYTNTLEQVYKIPTNKILYFHCVNKYYDEKNNFMQYVLGFWGNRRYPKAINEDKGGYSAKIVSSYNLDMFINFKHKIENYSNEYFKNMRVYKQKGYYEKSKSYCFTEDALNVFLNKIDDKTKIYFYGFSFGITDLHIIDLLIFNKNFDFNNIRILFPNLEIFNDFWSKFFDSEIYDYLFSLMNLCHNIKNESLTSSISNQKFLNIFRIWNEHDSSWNKVKKQDIKNIT